MGDYFQQIITVVTVPEPAAIEPPVNSADALELDMTDVYAELAEALNDNGWSINYDFGRSDWTAAKVREAIETNESFTVDEGRFDELENIGAVLTKYGCSWYGWVEPKYEFPGTYTAYHPDLGEFSAECDAEGNVTLTEYTLRKEIDEAVSLDALRDQINRLTGRAWHEALFPITEETATA